MTDDLIRNRVPVRAGIAPAAAAIATAFAIAFGLAGPGRALAQPGPDRANKRVPVKRVPVRIQPRPGQRGDRVRDARKPGEPANARTRPGNRPERRVGAPADDPARARRLTRVKQQAALRASGRADREKLLRRAARRRVTVALARARAAERPAMAQALLQEHRRSARRIARLYRIQAVAAAAGDVEAIDRTERLIALEQARHARWMTTFETRAARQGRAPGAGDGHGHAPGDGHGHGHAPGDGHGHGHAPGDGHGHAPGDGHGHAPAGRKGGAR